MKKVSEKGLAGWSDEKTGRIVTVSEETRVTISYQSSFFGSVPSVAAYRRTSGPLTTVGRKVELRFQNSNEKSDPIKVAVRLLGIFEIT